MMRKPLGRIYWLKADGKFSFNFFILTFQTI